MAWVAAILGTLLSLLPLGMELRQLLATLGDDGGRLIVMTLAGWAAQRRHQQGDGPFTDSWKYLAWSLWTCAVGDLLIVVSRLGGFQAHPASFYSWYGLNAVRIALLGVAILAWPVRPTLPRDRQSALVSGILVGWATFTLAWPLLLQPILQSTAYRAPWLAVGTHLAYVGIAAAWFIQESRSVGLGLEGPRRLIRGGLGLLVICVSAYAYLRLSGRIQVHGLAEVADLLWQASGALFGLAALHPARAQGGVELPQESANLPSLWLYAPVGLALAMSLGLIGSGRSLDGVTAVALVLLCLLFSIKEFLHHRNLARLSLELEARVQERSRELAKIQLEQLHLQRTQLVATLNAGMVHDLKNLLGAIGSWVHLYGLDDAPETREACLRGVEQANTQAIRLLKEQLSAGGVAAPQPEAFGLRGHCEHIRPLLEAALYPNALRLEMDEALPDIYMDPGHLDQVLLNLASNARDAMSGTGTFSLRASRDRLEPFVCLVAEDEGCGMTPELMEQIFKPFFTTKGKGVGTGLGLPSVRAVILEAGGRIAVRSTPGAGTTFTLMLPLAHTS